MNFGGEMMIKVMLFVSNEFWWIFNFNESAVLKIFDGLFVSGDEGDVEYYEEDEEREKKIVVDGSLIDIMDL